MIVALAACSSAEAPAEELAESAEEVRYGARDDANEFPYVGQLALDWGSGCSGVLITPLWVLTASHCVTGAQDGAVCIGWARGGPSDLRDQSARITFAVDPRQPELVQAIGEHTLERSGPILTRTGGAPVNLCSSSGAAKDVALIRLDRRIPVRQVRPIRPPIDRFGNEDPRYSCYSSVADTNDFAAWSVGFGRIGWSDSVTYRTHYLNHDWDYEDDGGGEWYIENKWTSWLGYTGPLEGDSGGALVHGGRLCGVNSRHYPTASWLAVGWGADVADIRSPNNRAFLHAAPVIDSEGNFLGECNSGPIEGRDVDTDGDGLPDSCDPCPLTPDPEYRFTGIIKRTTDDDGDGFDDACDPCPPSLCIARGGTASDCYNQREWTGPDGTLATWSDLDGDGIADVCDSCPRGGAWPNSILQAYDPDFDGVGSACDNCKGYNPWSACKSNSDCYSANQGLQCILDRGVPIAKWGRCEGERYACSSRVPCASGARCLEIGAWGHCALQPDTDNDGLGDDCDNCRTVKNSPDLQANSNDRAELRESAEALGDACDAVPTYISRGVIELAIAPSHSATRTTFRSSASLGVDADTGNQPGAVVATVGFRHCSCLNGLGTPISEEECWRQSICDDDPDQYLLSPGDPALTWSRITTGATGTLDEDPRFIPLTYNREVRRTFNGQIACNDDEPHPNVGEPCRLGPQEYVVWGHQADIEQGRVRSYFDGITRTAGVFWSHAYNAGHWPSNRDRLSDGRLRDNYEYVKTPLFERAIPRVPEPASRCQLFACFGWWNPGWIINPADSRINPSILTLINTPARVRPAVGGGFVAVRGNEAGVDITELMTPALRQMLADPEVAILTPVESASRGKLLSMAAHWVGMPRTWTPGARIEPVYAMMGGLATVPNKDAQHRMQTQASVFLDDGEPTERADVRAIYSGVDDAVYVLGGQAGGSDTGEIWRYHVLAQSWERLYAPLPISGLPDVRSPAPGRVQAASYDSARGKLVFLDHKTVSVPLLGKQTLGRFVLFDLHRKERFVSLTLPIAGVYEKLTLTAQDDGSFVLVGARKWGTKWDAYRFSIDDKGKLSWLGFASGNGKLLDEPLNLGEGVLLPLEKGGEEELFELGPSRFFPNVLGCEQI